MTLGILEEIFVLPGFILALLVQGNILRLTVIKVTLWATLDEVLPLSCFQLRVSKATVYQFESIHLMTTSQGITQLK